MQTAASSSRALLDPPLPLRVKLSALWASLTFCYLYGDYFGLYRPGKLQHMLEGAGPMGPASQGSLLFDALLLVVPGLMAFLSLGLPARLARSGTHWLTNNVHAIAAPTGQTDSSPPRCAATAGRAEAHPRWRR